MQLRLHSLVSLQQATASQASCTAVCTPALAVHADGERGGPAEGAAVMAAGGACPAEGVPALRHHGINLIGEADAAAVRLPGGFALRLQVCNGLQGEADLQISALRAHPHVLRKVRH